jgi:VanZ family protein
VIPDEGPVPPAAPVAAAARNRRAAFWAAFALLLAATLSPRLEVPAVDSPIDKLAHAAGFGIVAGLAFLAFRGARRTAVAAAMLAAAAADEAAQAIPALGRSADVLDLAADGVGIAIAAAFAAALAPPPGGGTAELLFRRRRLAGDLLLARPLNWMHLCTAAVLGAAAGAPLAVFVDSWFVRKGPQPWQYGLVGGTLGAMVAAHALWEAGVRSRLARASRERPCLGCGSPLPGGGERCAACGRARRDEDWAPVAQVRGMPELRACLVPAAIAFAALVVGNAVALAAVATLRLRSDTVGRFDAWYRDLPPDGRVLVDLVFVALLGAWALGRCRRRLAALADRGGERCCACGFDLRATAPGARVGTCHECGEGFVRLGGAPPAA